MTDLAPSTRTRQPVNPQLPGAVTARPVRDFDRLLAYMTPDGPFATRREELRQQMRAIRQTPTQTNINNALIDALDFRFELDMWVPMAERLYDTLLDSQQAIAHAAAVERHQSGGARASVQLARDTAKADVGPLKEAAGQLRHTHDSLVKMIYALRDMLQHLDTDEGLANLRENVDVPESRYEPVALALPRFDGHIA